MRRYAIYFCPDTSTPLGAFGAEWLGRAIDGHEIDTPLPDGISRTDWKAATFDARRYGFHATLKPPFRLSPEATEGDLTKALEAFCQANGPVPLGTLAVQRLSGFFALRPERDEPVTAFADACVRTFDGFRAPATADEVARRRPDTLTQRQKHLLDRWGYPYVMDEFRFHMTLTGTLPDPDIHMFGKTLEARYAPLLEHTVTINDICLLHQETRNDDFVLAGRYTLGGK